MQFEKKNLYRKMNTKARGVHHFFWGKYKHLRNKKRETIELERWSMHGKQKRGLDYTPLFKFLLKKVWSKWDDVYSEAVSRLDKPEPIFWIVAVHDSEKEVYIWCWESSYYSGMYVNNNGILCLTKPDLKPSDIGLFCSCCTHTLNWEVYKEEDIL